MSYVETKENFSTEYPTWIIGYCIDTDSFFFARIRDAFSGNTIRNLSQKNWAYNISESI